MSKYYSSVMAPVAWDINYERELHEKFWISYTLWYGIILLQTLLFYVFYGLNAGKLPATPHAHKNNMTLNQGNHFKEQV